MKASAGQCKWKESFYFLLTALDHDFSLSVKLYSRSSVRRKLCLGQVSCSDVFWDNQRLNASSWGLIAFSLVLAGSAGIWQPSSRSSGAVEGHDGSSRESSVCMAPAEPCLNLPAWLHLCTLWTRCSHAAGPVGQPRSCTLADWTPMEQTANHWTWRPDSHRDSLGARL